MGFAEPDQAGGDASAQVERAVAVEDFIGSAELDAGQQLLLLRVAVGERIDDLLAVLIHLFLLDAVADENCSRGEAGFAGGVLGMEMGGGEVELLAGREFGGDFGDGRAVAGTEAGVDRQSGVRADNDADIGEAEDGPDVIGNLDGVLAEDGVGLAEAASRQLRKAGSWLTSTSFSNRSRHGPSLS